jgi:hypothetical protein
MSTLDKLEMVQQWAQNIIDAAKVEQQERAEDDEVERLRGDVQRLTDEKASLIHANHDLSRRLGQYERPACGGECGDPTPAGVSA